MKIVARFFIGILIMMCLPMSLKAQDVYIPVPANNIFNRTEFTTVQNILNTRSHTNWRLRQGSVDPLWPTIQSTTGETFKHTTLTTKSLPTEILQWQLSSAGNQPPPFRSGDVWPLPYLSFTSVYQYWYRPGSTIGNRTPGDVAFTFKIPSDKYAGNSFHAGNYKMGITHNYTTSTWFTIEFTPNTLEVILIIPAAIDWLTTTPTKYIEISSLNEYRTTSAHLLGDLGAAQIGNTVEFDLWAKASSSSIQFTSSKNVQGTRNISTIQLGSTHTKLITAPLSANEQNYSSPNFVVEVGNRNNFTLDLSISAADFKNHFFEAGTYTFQLNLDAKSTDGTVSDLQNTDVTLKVLALSEITIPTSGQTVNFDFNTSAHYSQGQSKVMPNQIKLSNNETFELYVKSDENYFKKGGVQTDINSNILQVGVDGSSSVFLSTVPQKIVSNRTPILDQELDMKYTIPASGAQSLVGKEKTTYSINVIYSFTAL